MPSAVHIRDSKRIKDGPVLTFGAKSWAAFSSHIAERPAS